MYFNTPYSSYNELINNIKNKKAVLRVDVYHFVKAIEFLNSTHNASLIVLFRFVPAVVAIVLYAIFTGKMYLLFAVIPAVIGALFLRINNFVSGFLATIGLTLISARLFPFFAILLIIPFMNEIGKRISFWLLSDTICKEVLNDENRFAEAYQNKLIVIEKEGAFFIHE